MGTQCYVKICLLKAMWLAILLIQTPEIHFVEVTIVS
jgi:hypothetical protein